MSTVAFVLAALIAIPPVAPQAPSSTARHDTISATAATAVVVPERLQRTFALLRQPGFHPELFDLLEIEAELALASTRRSPTALQGWHWALIGVAIAIPVLLLLVYLGYRNS